MRLAYIFAALAFCITGAFAQDNSSAQEKAFQQADKDHDGSLTPAEYAAYQELLESQKGGSNENS